MRSAVESVSLLFTRHQGDAASWAATGKPGPEVPNTGVLPGITATPTRLGAVGA
jgi:hypothetical protein